MFGTSQAAARARYRNVDLGSKVEGASPHRLIGILYEELLKTLDAMTAAMAGDAPRATMPARRARASSILLGLETSLDHANGGELSAKLALVYREARRLIGEGAARNDPQRIGQAREIVAEIAEAWNVIG